MLWGEFPSHLRRLGILGAYGADPSPCALRKDFLILVVLRRVC